jgi:hypothetical protein
MIFPAAMGKLTPPPSMTTVVGYGPGDEPTVSDSTVVVDAEGGLTFIRGGGANRLYNW